MIPLHLCDRSVLHTCTKFRGSELAISNRHHLNNTVVICVVGILDLIRTESTSTDSMAKNFPFNFLANMNRYAYFKAVHTDWNALLKYSKINFYCSRGSNSDACKMDQT